MNHTRVHCSAIIWSSIIRRVLLGKVVTEQERERPSTFLPQKVVFFKEKFPGIRLVDLHLKTI